jgi:membrane protease YdiL (CAAX protease family)
VDFQDLLLTLIAFSTIACVGGLASLFLWIVVLRGRGRLLPLQRLRPGCWQGREVVLVFLFMLFVPGMAQGFLEGIGFFQQYYGKDPTSEQKQLWYMTLAFPIIVAGSFLIMFILSGTRPRNLGLTTGRWPQNIILGWLAWLPLTLLTLGLYYLIRFWGIKGKEHSLGRALDNQAMVPEWVLGIFLALVIAPFLEELVFRGVLQGWLRRCSLLGHGIVAGSTLLLSSLSLIDKLQAKRDSAELTLGPTLFAVVLVAGYLWLLYQRRQRVAGSSMPMPEFAPLRQPEPDSETANAIRKGSPPLPVGEVVDHFTKEPQPTFPGQRAGNQQEPQRVGILAAIYGSAMLFAVFHSSVWPTPIPLFVLGLGLGWLAYRTQSLVGPITVHVLFNSVACLVLGLSVFYGKENGKAETEAFRPSLAGSSSTIVPGSWLPRFK